MTTQHASKTGHQKEDFENRLTKMDAESMYVRTYTYTYTYMSALRTCQAARVCRRLTNEAKPSPNRIFDQPRCARAVISQHVICLVSTDKEEEADDEDESSVICLQHALESLLQL